MYKILANTLFLGKNVVFVPECHSTNTLLLELSQKTNQPEGTIVITHSQTRGRGQRGNGWEAEPGMNLTFSLLLKPHFMLAKQQFDLTMAVSLGVFDFLSARIPGRVKIKWPNDLLIGEKKITGILIENGLVGEQIQQSIVGIGLNINQTVFSIATATSLKMETGLDFANNDELNALLQKLETRYLQLRAGKRAELQAAYLKNLYRIGETHSFVANGQKMQGRIDGVDESGRLKVHTDGIDRFFGLKEISFAYE
ncbi:MAG: biotin--[acetyl-CoA-carboxylase] ligase [Cyclobacteriaceae bacterium]|nr:biotin--[acetyl-CoA-carboxylase] ligase [Cyclobacteriaceae bacterium]